MAETIAKHIVLARRPTGRATLEDFQLEEMAMPSLPAGGVLLRSKVLSLDPYMRSRMDDRKSYAAPVPLGGVMEGEVVAEVIQTDHGDYAIGDLVLAKSGWCTYAASNGDGLRKIDSAVAPESAFLGVLGMPGFTAYSGLHVIGKPKAGETVVVAAASGPVGSLVGQLAKQAGAHVVGIAGGPDKCRYVTEVLGFDAAVDHRSDAFSDNLAVACAKGVDVYFENVGGAIWQAVMPLLNRFARVPVCGLIAQHTGSTEQQSDLLPATMRLILTRSLTVRGFINYEFTEALFPTFLKHVSDGLRNGQIQYKEDVTDGLENAPTAFIDMMEGRNFGKTLVRIAH